MLSPRGEHASRFSVGRALNQGIPTGIATPIVMDTFLFDGLNEFNSTVINAFQPRRAGIYYISAAVAFTAMFLGDFTQLQIYLNGAGTQKVDYKRCTIAGEDCYLATEEIIALTPNDYVQAYCLHNNVGVSFIGVSGIMANYLQGFRVG